MYLLRKVFFQSRFVVYYPKTSPRRWNHWRTRSGRGFSSHLPLPTLVGRCLQVLNKKTLLFKSFKSHNLTMNKNHKTWESEVDSRCLFYHGVFFLPFFWNTWNPTWDLRWMPWLRVKQIQVLVGWMSGWVTRRKWNLSKKQKRLVTFAYTPLIQLTWLAGKSPCSRGNTSSFMVGFPLPCLFFFFFLGGGVYVNILCIGPA